MASAIHHCPVTVGDYKSPEDLMKDVQLGDLIEIHRRKYKHWGVYVGNGYIVHVGLASNPGTTAIITRDKLTDVAEGNYCRVNNLVEKANRENRLMFDVSRILENAERREGDLVEYSFSRDNCERFVVDCRYMQHPSFRKVVLQPKRENEVPADYMRDVINVLSQHFIEDMWYSLFHLLDLKDKDKKLPRKWNNSREIIQSMLHIWAAESQEPILIGKLINLFQRSDFQSAAEDLQRMLESRIDLPLFAQPNAGKQSSPEKVRECSSIGTKAGLFIMATVVLGTGTMINFHMWRDNVPTPRDPVWYKMQRPNLNFNRNEDELESMLSVYKQYETSKLLTSIYVTGMQGIGKAEMARSFAYRLYISSRANCVWINGNILAAEFRIFNSSVYGEEMHEASSKIESTLPWLIIFDAVNTETSVVELNNILQTLISLAKPKNPFLVVTTIIKSVQPNSEIFKHTGFHVKLPGLENLCNVFNTAIAPYAYNRAGDDLQLVQNICFCLDALFRKLDSMVQNEATKIKASFSLMALLSHFLDGEIDSDMFVKFWAVAINETKRMPFLEDVFEAFLSTGLIEEVPQDSTKIQLKNVGFKTFFSDHYSTHPWVFAEFEKLLQFSPSDAEVHQWIMKSMVSFLGDNQCDLKGVPQISRFMYRLLNYDNLVKEFRFEVLAMQKCLDLNVLSLAFHKFLKVFGQADLHTLQLGESLAEMFVKHDMFIDSAELYGYLYKFKKEKFGKIDNRTFEAGDRAIHCYKVLKLYTEAYLISREMAANCEMLECNVQLLKRQRQYDDMQQIYIKT